MKTWKNKFIFAAILSITPLVTFAEPTPPITITIKNQGTKPINLEIDTYTYNIANTKASPTPKKQSHHLNPMNILSL